MTPFPYDVIGQWMATHNIDLKSEAYNDLAELFVEYSESEEYNSDKEVVGSDCLCVLGSKKHLPNCEYADTPAKEWREELRTLMQMEAMPTLEAFIQNLIDSRDAEIAQLKEELTDIVKDS